MSRQHRPGGSARLDKRNRLAAKRSKSTVAAPTHSSRRMMLSPTVIGRQHRLHVSVKKEKVEARTRLKSGAV